MTNRFDQDAQQSRTPMQQRAALIAALIFLIASWPAISHSQPSDSDLRQEWDSVQLNKDREAKKRWWRAVGPEELTAYLEAGAEVAIADRRGWTPLHSAARYNPDPDILSSLIGSGADVDARNNTGETPLHWAAADNSNVEIITALLKAGAEVNARDNFGWLPIHTAAETSSNPDVIDALLEAGSKRNKRAYFIFFRPVFLLKHNANMSSDDRELAMALLKGSE